MYKCTQMYIIERLRWTLSSRKMYTIEKAYYEAIEMRRNVQNVHY